MKHANTLHNRTWNLSFEEPESASIVNGEIISHDAILYMFLKMIMFFQSIPLPLLYLIQTDIHEEPA